MKRKPYIKQNSYTQRKGRYYLSNIEKICQLTEMSRNEWNELFFDFGCHLAEHIYEDALYFLSEPKECYWNSLMMIYLKDDESLLTHPKLNKEVYFDYKDMLMNRLNRTVSVDDRISNGHDDLSGSVLVS